MDFTSASLESPKNGESNDKAYVQDCILVFEFVEEGTRQLEYLDFLCDTPHGNNKNDYFFVLEVWLRLFQLYPLCGGFDSVEVWSDGGPHHFKTSYCQWMWHLLSTACFAGKPITHNFFSAYHGHSLADSHAATDKRILHTEYNSSQQQRLLPTVDSLYWGPSSAADLAALLSAHATKTQAFTLQRIPRDASLKPSIQTVAGIKGKHSFVYAMDTCRYFDRTNEGEGKQFWFKPTP